MEEADDANSTSSSGNSFTKPLDLRRLGSKEKTRKASVEKRQTIDRSDDHKIWGAVKGFSMSLVDKLVEVNGKVPKEIEALANLKYMATTNSSWCANAIREFQSTELKVLMQIYHGKKKDSIASTCAFLAKLTSLPEEKNANPAYILQHFGLWDNSELGLTTSIPTELLDRSLSRSAEEDSEFKTGVNLFVAGIVIYGLVKLDEINKGLVVESTRTENKASRGEKLAILADRLEQMLSASKGTPKVVEGKRKSARKATAPGLEFKSPRSPELTPRLKEAAKEEKGGSDLEALHNQIASQGVLIEKLLAENKSLHESLLGENRKLKELLAAGHSKETQKAEDKTSAFAKLAEVNLRSKGKNDYHDIDNCDICTDVDGMSELSSAISSDKSPETNRCSGMSELEKSARQSIFSATKVSTTKAPAPWARLVSRLSNEHGIYVCDCQGNVFRMIQDAKTKSTKAYDVQFTLTLEYPLWATKQEIELDETCSITQRWPQNWIQMKMYFEEQLLLLERDMDEEHRRDRAKPFYDPGERYKIVKQFYRTLKDIARGTVGLREEPSHPKHIQVFALISHFVYVLWTSAMVTSQTTLLTEDPMGIWTRHYDIKMTVVQGKIDFPMKMAVVWLGYGCKGKCKRSGMCPGLCLYCNTDIVVASVQGSTGSKKVGSTTVTARFESWKREMLSKDTNAKVSFSDFTKNGPKMDKSSVKKERVTEEEYFEWLEENQHCFKLDIPSDFIY
jgi:hypothetical protein